MGTSKAALDWFGVPLLARVAGLVGRAVDGPVVVVRAPGQGLPPLPARVEVVDDPVEGRGPLQGIAVGLEAVAGRAGAAFVTATDLPLLHPAYVRRVLAMLDEDADVVVPQVHDFPQPLAAAYRVSLSPLVTSLVSEGVRRPPELFTRCRVVRPDEEELLAGAELARVDPQIDSLRGVNTPDELAAVRARPAPQVAVAEGPPVAARTLGEATALLAARHGPAARIVLAGAVDAVDPAIPLVPGDVLAVRVTPGPAGVVAGDTASRRT